MRIVKLFFVLSLYFSIKHILFLYKVYEVKNLWKETVGTFEKITREYDLIDEGDLNYSSDAHWLGIQYTFKVIKNDNREFAFRSRKCKIMSVSELWRPFTAYEFTNRLTLMKDKEKVSVEEKLTSKYPELMKEKIKVKHHPQDHRKSVLDARYDFKDLWTNWIGLLFLSSAILLWKSRKSKG